MHPVTFSWSSLPSHLLSAPFRVAILRLKVNINEREMEGVEGGEGSEEEGEEVLGAVPFKVFVCPQVLREDLMESLNAERSGREESAEYAAVREQEMLEERERKTQAEALGASGLTFEGEDEMEESSAPGLVFDCVCFDGGEVDILSVSTEPTDYEAGLMDMDEDVHKPYRQVMGVAFPGHTRTRAHAYMQRHGGFSA